MSTHHNEVALHAIKLRDRGKESPALEAEALKQFQTRLVMSEDQSDQRCYPQRRRAGDRLLQQTLPHAAPPEFFIHVNTDLGRATIRAAWQEFFEIEPADHAAVRFRDPERIVVRRMFAEPGQTRFDRGRLKLGCHHAGRHSGIVNVDDRRQIGLHSISDDHFVCTHRINGPVMLSEAKHL